MDQIGWNFSESFTLLTDHLYSHTNPTTVKDPSWFVINESLIKDLNLNVESFKSDDNLAILSGNKLVPGTKPIAQAYAGHQFGRFTMLGDGRAILLGEHVMEDGNRVDIQLKGAGKTPYSRSGDGRATLSSILREYLMSEAMHGLRIPTTRSLAVVKTGDMIMREASLPGAILTRVASSHLRIGTFQYVRQYGTEEELRQLTDYAIQRHYPHLENVSNRYLAFLKEVVERQAKLIVKWNLVGFVHGVMNTDNMTISGETIDYGPCAFIDQYNPRTVFSSIDQHGRYAYNQQKPVAVWNLARLAEALLPILADEEKNAIHGAEALLNYFSEIYEKKWFSGMKSKLGFFEDTKVEPSLINHLFDLMEKFQADYTDTFRALTTKDFSKQAWFGADEFIVWLTEWKLKVSEQSKSKDKIEALMKRSNPAIIPRNYLVEEALGKAVAGEDEYFNQLLAALENPYAYTDDKIVYTDLPPETDQPYRTFCGT